MSAQKNKPTDPKQTPVTEPAQKKFPHAMIWAAIVMVAAVFIVIAILMRNQTMRQELDTLKEDLSASQGNWQQIASDKEVLQDELAEVEDSIREASLTYDESTAKAADLTEQIGTLSGLNASLENQVTVSAETETVYLKQTETLTDTLRVLQAADQSLAEELNSKREYTGSLWAAVIDSRNTLLQSLKETLKALKDDLSLAESRLAALPESGMEEKADEIRGEIQQYTTDLEDVKNRILMYGTPADLEP